jgi:chorismate mutase
VLIAVGADDDSATARYPAQRAEVAAPPGDAIDAGTIDDIDKQLIGLTLLRRQLVLSAQQERARRGQPKIEATREAAVARRYAATLGSAGAEIAATLIRFCRREN